MKEIKKEEYTQLNYIFIEKVKELEKLHKEKLEEDKIELPLASNFVCGETVYGTITGSPGNRLPEWVKELLSDAWNKSIEDFSK